MDFETAKKEFSRWFVVKKYDEFYISINEDNGGLVLLNQHIDDIRDVYMNYDMIIEFLKENKFTLLRNYYYTLDYNNVRYCIELLANSCIVHCTDPLAHCIINSISYTPHNLIEYLKVKLGLYIIKPINKYDLY